MTNDVIQIEKPALVEVPFAKVLELNIGQDHDVVHQAIQKTQFPEYLHWGKLRFKSWIPKGLSALEFWSFVKLFRRNGSRLIIKDEKGRHFTWLKLTHYDKQLHELDLNTGGRLANTNILSGEERKSFISRGILEEAIASAQLEGAHTTRDVAKKIIEEGQTPRNRGQKMIVNNYQTMSRIEEDFKNRDLSIELLFEMHRMLTEETLDKPDQVGRFRKDDENIVVANEEGVVAYIPPTIEFVKSEMDRLIAYANDLNDDRNEFLHPVVKAITLHFWMGFLHPFADGNGRLARALFYWYLLKKDYWTFAFIPVSTRIKKSPKQYAYAYILSEQDDNDLTYFIDYNLRKIELAKRDFMKFIEDKKEKSQSAAKLSKKYPDLNHRQLSLIEYLQACPKERTNVSAMTKIYGVSEMTAINDLRYLLEKGYLTKKRAGRNVFYYPTDKLLT